ncbi:MAG: hypothetical protein WKF43_05965 [Acidimicrobiales bacterium]
MTEAKRPVDHALDLFVFAPLGFALEARTLLPKLINRGRDQVNGQVTLARMMGEFAVQKGQTEAEKRLSRAQAQATTTLTDLGLLPRDEPSRPAPAHPTPSSEPVATRPRAAPDPKAAPPPPKAGLAIPDYDSLAASQVIPRLAGLAGAELEAVRSYEAAKRGRKTILNKISQLQG